MHKNIFKGKVLIKGDEICIMNNSINKEKVNNLFTAIKNEIFENGTDEEYNEYIGKVQNLQIEFNKGEINMKKKSKKENDILELKVVNGYAIYNTNDKNYVNEDCYECEEDELPYIYDNIDEAKDVIEESNYPENHEIHKLKYTLQVEEVYKREIVYNLIAGEVE